MNKKIAIFVIAFLVTFFVFSFARQSLKKEVSGVTDFETCVSSGAPVMESYPRQCNANGKTYTENIGNTLEKRDLIILDNPLPNQKISNPIVLSGRARGTWFFEASFPGAIYDSNGKLLGTFPVSAGGDWMTTGFVPFEATFKYIKPATKSGTLVLKKDNPSGDPTRDDELRIPIRFE